MKLVVQIETGLGGTRAWVHSDEPIEDIIIVLAPADNVAGEEAAIEATEVVEPERIVDALDLVEAEIAAERAAYAELQADEGED